MKIERFRVRSYGHFRDRELRFTDAPLHVVYGPNEAGKTTLLAALRDLLFGVPHRSTAGFAYGNAAIELSASLALASRGRLDVVRTKTRREPLTGEWTASGGKRAVDESVMARLLAPMDRGLFEAVFGFTLRDLEAGGELLRHAGVRELLAGGALGGAGDRIQSVLGALDGDADGLWIARGKRQPINETLREAKEALESARGSALGRAGLLEVQAQVAETEKTVADLERQLHDVRASRLRFTRLHASLALWAQSQELTRLLEEDHADPAIEDAALAAHLLQVIEERSAARARIGQLDADAREQEELASADPPDEALLDVAETVESLERRQRDLGHRRRENQESAERLGEEREECLRALHDLAPGLDGADFEREAWCVTALEPVADLLAEVARVGQLVSEATSERDELSDALAPDHAALERSRSGEDPETLAPLIKLGETYREARHRAAAAEEDLAEVESRVARGRRSLSPALGSDAPLAELRLPSPESVTALLGARDAIDEALARLDASTREAQQRSARHGAVADELEAAEVPDPGALDAARAERAAAWRAVREAVDGAVRSDDQGPRVVAFEEAMEKADRIADRLREASEFVTRRIDARAGAADAEAVLETLGRARADTAAELEEWEASWAAQFDGLGVIPETEIAESWLRAVADLKDLDVRRALARTASREAQDQVAELAGRLREAVDPTVDDDAADGLVERLGPRRDAALESAGQRRELEDRCTRGAAELARRDERLAELNGRGVIAAEEAAQGWSAIGIEPTLVPAAAERHVDRLRALHERTRNLIGDETGLEISRRQVAGFDAQVARLLADLGRSQGPLTLDEALARMHTELVEARARSKERARSIEAAERKRKAAAEARRSAESLDVQITEACERYDLDGESPLREACERAVTRAQLSADLADADSKLSRNLARGGEPERDRAALATSDEAALQAEAERLGDLETGLEQRLKESQREMGSLGEQERSLGGDLSVRARARYEECRGQLDDLCDRWVELRLARVVLGRVVDRFVRDHQPDILSRATELVTRLTVGRYVRVIQPPGADVLALESADGEVKLPDALSTGTHQQMFLALRLAYVLEYAQQAEPLPLIMDDVLVNVDESRQAATLSALADVGKDLQVIYFTCHQSLVDRVRGAVPAAEIQTLDRPDATAVSDVKS